MSRGGGRGAVEVRGGGGGGEVKRLTLASVGWRWLYSPNMWEWWAMQGFDLL